MLIKNIQSNRKNEQDHEQRILQTRNTNANNHLKPRLISLPVKEIQTKTKYHLLKDT